MQKIIYILTLVFLFQGCSKPSSNNKDKDSNGSNTEDYILEGTVVKIFNLIIPSAHATSFSVLLQNDNGECDNADRCAFLIEVRDSEELLIAKAPVISGTFKFKLKIRPLPNVIYKVVVRGWNPDKKEIILGSNDRELVFMGDEISGKLDVTPESSYASRRRVEVLKSNRSEVLQIIRTFLYDLHDLIKEGNQSLREALLAILESTNGQIYDFIDKIQDKENNPQLDIELYLQKISTEDWNEKKVRLVPKLILYQHLNRMNQKISETNSLLGDLSQDYEFSNIILDYYSKQNSYIQASLLQEEIILDEEALLLIEDESEKLIASQTIFTKYDQIESILAEAQGYKNSLDGKCQKFMKYFEIVQLKYELEKEKNKINEWNSIRPIVSLEDQEALNSKLSPILDSANDLNQEERENILEYCNELTEKRK